MLTNLTKAQTGILFGISCAFMVSVMATLVKSISQDVPIDMIIFFRFFVGFIYILIIFGIRRLQHRPVKLKTKYFKLHLLRTICAMMALLMFFYSLIYIPLVDASLLNTTYPLFIPIIVIITTGIKTSKKMWLSIIIGFVGIAFVLKPGHELFNPVSFIALGSGLAAAFGLLIARQLSKHDETHSIMFYYFLLSGLASGSLLFWHWHAITLKILLVLIAIGFVGSLYQELLIRAMAKTSARIVSSLMYLVVPFAGLFDWIFWRYTPDALTFVGVVLVCTGAILAITFYHKQLKGHIITHA